MVTILVLVTLIALVYWGFPHFAKWTAHKAGTFTVFRVVFPDGRYADFVAYDAEDCRRLSQELRNSQATGEAFTAGGAVQSFTVIPGRDHDGQWMGSIKDNSN